MGKKKLNHKDFIYSSEEKPGILRKRWGKGFIYYDEESGEKIRGKEILKRIKKLVIPPGWQNVWIAREEEGHLQATGMDVKGRKQYIYHPKWLEYRNNTKFDRIGKFARSLPEIRRVAQLHLREPEWTRGKILGLIVQLLDESHLRIGNRCYREQNQTFGLTTLRRKHLTVNGKDVIFRFKAKSGIDRTITIENEELGDLVKQCSELPGYDLFRFQAPDHKWQHITSADVNAYLQFITGEDFTSKDFRTWGGTVLVLEYEGPARKVVEENSKKKFDATLVKMVAQDLGNTPAVCRDYYIHPKVLKAVLDNRSGEFEKYIKKEYDSLSDVLDENELKALAIIENS